MPLPYGSMLPGYIDNNLSVENMYSLTGIHLAESDLPGELRVRLTSADHPYTASLPTGLAYGTDVNIDKIKATFKEHVYLQDTMGRDLPGLKISPRFYGDDKQATVLGRLVGLDKPGLLVKEQVRMDLGLFQRTSPSGGFVAQHRPLGWLQHI